MSKTFDKIKENWDQIIEKMRQDNDISSVVFEAYVKKPLKLLSYEKQTLYVEVPQEGYVAYLNKNLLVPLRVSIAEVMNFSLDDINIVFQTKIVDKNDKTITKDAFDNRLKSIGVNPSFTFENFVQGNTNELAYATSVAVSEKPGDIYNPLFIYGGTGLGKTHLLSAIAEHAIKKNPDINVLYMPCVDFKNEFIISCRIKNNTQEFRSRFDNIDILIIDDIQELIGAESTQTEFFTIFNSLVFEKKKQIVLASDKPPKDLNGIEERIKSRFSQGAICDVKLPDYETRIAILRKKEEEYKSEFSIDSAVINYIAQKVQSNIRELEGCLKKIILKSRLEKKPISLNQAKKILQDLTQEEVKKVTPDLIIKTVSEYYGVDILEMCGKKRNSEFKLPRNICIYLCRELIQDITQEKIGTYFSNRDHSTIINSCKFVDEKLLKDNKIREEINVIKKKMGVF